MPPEISADNAVRQPVELDVIYHHSATDMSMVAPASVALVVTSPPYFAGKAYEEDLGANGVPSSYAEYLDLLVQVFTECKRVLEPGGRIAVNVANLGRHPFRSLSGDVTTILQDLGLLLRGEVMWWKGRAAGGSCAWGTFQRPHNPVLRDVTERVIIASKGRFDRAFTAAERAARQLPSTTTISRDEFLDATTDLWEIAPERASRVGHPAPFPVELPRRLIELFTYQDDLVLDPFMGSGTTAIAAIQSQRHFVGFDTDRDYVGSARERVAIERAACPGADVAPLRVELPAIASSEGPEPDPVTRAMTEGRSAKDIARLLVETCGFHDITPAAKVRGVGVELSFMATDAGGGRWAFDVTGSFTSTRNGLVRADVLWRAIGKAAVLHEADATLPLVLLTTDAPTRGSAGHRALETVRGPGRPVWDVIELLDPTGYTRLRDYARGRASDGIRCP